MGGRVLVLFADRAARGRWGERLETLAAAGYILREADNPRQAEAEVEAGPHEAALLVVSATGNVERRLIDLVTRLSESAAVVVVAGAGTETFVRDLLIAGARDVLSGLPGDAEVGAAIARAVRAGRAPSRAARFDPELPLSRQLGASPAAGRAIRLIGKAAGSSAPVLVTGEPGSGKTIVARAIHAHLSNPRRGGPFVRCLLRATEPAEAARILFGAGRRPGLYDLAQDGTLYVDEVWVLPVLDQARLLEMLEAGAGPRVIAGTTAPLGAAVKEGRLKRELFTALKVLPIDLPPLRERPADVPALATAMIDRHAARLDKSIVGLSRGALAALQRHAWPGNIRELERRVEAAVARARGPLIDEEDLAELKGKTGASRAPAGPCAPGAIEIVVCVDESLPLPEISRRATSAAEIVAIRRALDRAGGNISHAARVLGVSRSHIQKRIRIYGLRVR